MRVLSTSQKEGQWTLSLFNDMPLFGKNHTGDLQGYSNILYILIHSCGNSVTRFIHNVVSAWQPIGHALVRFKEMFFSIQTLLPYITAPEDMRRIVVLRLN